jgi:hypothetical protein
MHPIGLDSIRFGIDFHLWPHVVELHVPLADVPAILDCFYALAQAISFHDARGDGGLGHEGNACLRDHRGEHGAHDDGFDGGDGCVRVALEGCVSCGR